VTICASPHGICTDWQTVTATSPPRDDVRHTMTPWPVTAGPDTPVPELAHQMLTHVVHQIVVVDPDGRPVGILSVTDILRAVAGIDPAGTGGTP
jgi:CBS domain-containing protein